MSDTTEIKALTINVPTTFRTSAACDRVKIHNNSSFYLQVYFFADPPSGANVPGWHATIDPGDKPLIGIVGAQSNPFADRTYVQSTPYLGTIIILPFLPAGLQLQSGGVVSGGSFCHITAYYPGEFAESTAGDEAYVQAVKQARYQAITGGVERYTASVDQATATGNFALVNGAAFWTMTPARCPAIFDWFGTHGFVFLMVHFYGLFASYSPSNAVAVGVNFHVEAVLRDPTDAFDKGVETLGIYKGGSNAGANPNQTVYIHDQPSHPVIVPIFIGALASGDIFRVRYIRDGLAGAGTFAMAMNADVLVDEVNQSTYFDRPYTSVAYLTPGEATYTPTGNPQTW